MTAVGLEGGGRVVREDRQGDPAGTSADNNIIGDDPSRRQRGHSSCPHSRAYGSRGRTVVARLHGQEVEGGGTEYPAWIGLFIDDVVTAEVQLEAERGRCLALSQAFMWNHHQAMGERAQGGEPLLSHQKVTDWAPRQEGLGLDLNTERMTISLPDNRNINELQKMFD